MYPFIHYSQVYGAEWNPHEVTHGTQPAFVTFGRKHIKLWSPSDAGATTFVGKALSFGRMTMQARTLGGLAGWELGCIPAEPMPLDMRADFLPHFTPS